MNPFDDVMEAMMQAAETMAELPVEEWAGWIDYLLEALESRARSREEYKAMLKALYGDLSTRLQAEKW